MAFSKQSAFQKPKVIHKKKQQKMSSLKRRGTVISLPTLQEEVVPEQVISNPEVEMKPATYMAFLTRRSVLSPWRWAKKPFA